MRVAEEAAKPWATWLERQIESALRAKGIEDGAPGRLQSKTMLLGRSFTLEVFLDGEELLTMKYVGK